MRILIQICQLEQVLHQYLHRRLKEFAARIAAMRKLRREELQVCVL